MNRRASTSDFCDRCGGCVSPDTALVKCGCTEDQINQFLLESPTDRKLVNRMLFLHRQSESVTQQPKKRRAYTKEYRELYGVNEQLAKRNSVRSPYSV